MSEAPEPTQPPPAIEAALRYAGSLQLGGLSLTSALTLAAAEYSQEIWGMPGGRAAARTRTRSLMKEPAKD